MKITLVKPCWIYPITREEHTYNRTWPPLSLANCAAILEQDGHEVEVLDAHALRLPPEEVARRCKGADKIFITSSALDRWQCPNLNIEPLFATLSWLKQLGRDVYLMGFHGTAKPEEMLERGGVKAVIRREPEFTVREICRRDRLDGLPGVVFHSDGTLVKGEEPKAPELSEFPVPAFHKLPIERYLYEILGKRFMLFEASRGCPYPCTFCSRVVQGKPVRRKTIEQVRRELDHAILNCGVQSGYFIDLEFTVNRGLVMQICDYLIEKDYDFDWCCQTRPDLVDEELLRRMKAAKCRIIHFGVETGSKRMMELIQKKISIEKIEEGLALVKKVGIKSLCFFMLGLPGETEEEMRQTIEYSKKLNPTFASFHHASPYPGSEFYDMIDHSDGELFPVINRGDHTQEQLEKMIRTALRAFYLRPTYILSRLREGHFDLLWKQFKLFLAYMKAKHE